MRICGNIGAQENGGIEIFANVGFILRHPISVKIQHAISFAVLRWPSSLYGSPAQNYADEECQGFARITFTIALPVAARDISSAPDGDMFQTGGDVTVSVMEAHVT